MSNFKKQYSYATLIQLFTLSIIFCCIDVVVIPLKRFGSVMMGITEHFSDLVSSFGRRQGILVSKMEQ